LYFFSSNYPIYNFEDYLKTANELYRQIDPSSKSDASGSQVADGRANDGKADSVVCSVISQQLKEAVSKSANNLNGSVLLLLLKTLFRLM